MTTLFAARPTRAQRRPWSIALAALLLAACGGGAEVLFVPFFSFGFAGTVNAAPLSVFLKPSDDCSVDGTLPASANLSLAGVGDSAITGTYNQRALTITLTTPPVGLAKVYDGRFESLNTLVFTPRGAGAAFTVTRIDVGVALRACPG